MKVNTINKTDFKGVNVVKVSKKAFSNPSDIKECNNVFKQTLSSVVGIKRKGLLGSLLALFFPKFSKLLVFMEKPSYYAAKTGMNTNNNNYSISWLKYNTGLPIKDSAERDFHTFSVLTKEHKDKMIVGERNIMKNMLGYMREGIARYPEDKNMSKLYFQVKIGTENDKNVESILKDTKVKEFKIDSLNELNAIAKDFN